MKKKCLPIGIQSFPQLIEKDCIYIDKTKYILDLIDKGSWYFLSRPRRFGKSLLLSTLAEIFKGNKELFKDCYIYNSDYKWIPYNVIRLSLSSLDTKSPDLLEQALTWKISSITRQHSISVDDAL